jgi:Signal transduction histidine kinase regulating C4-dicarboxylate transport system
MLNLASAAENQKNTIDLYLQERIANLYNLLQSREFTLQPNPSQMESYLYTLKRFSDSFIDVGFLNAQGIQIGYAGPYPSLLGQGYSQESWYNTLIHGEKNHLITDSYLGFRNAPHFTIAVRQFSDGQVYVMRASLYPDKLYMFLRSMIHGKEVKSTLINREGVYQVVDPSDHNFFPKRSEYTPPFINPSGLEEIDRDNLPMLVVYSWLDEAQWVLVTMQPLSAVQSDMYRTQLILTSGLLLISLFISFVIFLTIKRLIDNTRRMAEKEHHLQEMLSHASKLASIGELAEGVAHEINNPLAIIMATSGVIRDMLNPEFDLDHSPEAISEELSVIDKAATRAKDITRKLQKMGKNRVPRAERCAVNTLIEEVINRLNKVELKSKNIEVVTKYAPSLPEILAEPDPLRQVFTNILINARDAITDKGTITVTTELCEAMVCVTITDTGKGIPSENLSRIFNPFFTTKGGGKGTGLGLSIAASIVKYLVGTIEVHSIVGTGSSFTILLPIDALGKNHKL